MVDRFNLIPGCGIGPLAARPAPSEGLRFWVDETTKRLSVNLGSEWVGIAEVGAVAPATVVVAGTSEEGSSVRSARADHVHSLPLATTSAHGAMSAADKAKLDGATSSPTAETLAQRDSDGQFQVMGPPKNVNYAANKAYVDSGLSQKSGTGHKHDAADTVSGTFAPARLPLATADANGAMPSTDKAKLDGAGTSGSNNLVQRNSAGSTRLNSLYLDGTEAPDSNMAVRRDYVDAKKWSGSDITSGTIDPARIQKATPAADGLMPSTDKAKLDGATPEATANKIVTRNAAGDATLNQLVIGAGNPVSPGHAASKQYVDRRTVIGQISVNAEANVPTEVGISFPPGQFSVTPAILVTPYGAQGSFDGPVTLTNVSLVGATINFTRKISGTVVVAWAAIA